MIMITGHQEYMKERDNNIESRITGIIIKELIHGNT
jgi:hypothetical protein